MTSSSPHLGQSIVRWNRSCEPFVVAEQFAKARPSPRCARAPASAHYYWLPLFTVSRRVRGRRSERRCGAGSPRGRRSPPGSSGPFRRRPLSSSPGSPGRSGRRTVLRFPVPARCAAGAVVRGCSAGRVGVGRSPALRCCCLNGRVGYRPGRRRETRPRCRCVPHVLSCAGGCCHGRCPYLGVAWWSVVDHWWCGWSRGVHLPPTGRRGSVGEGPERGSEYPRFRRSSGCLHRHRPASPHHVSPGHRGECGRGTLRGELPGSPAAPRRTPRAFPRSRGGRARPPRRQRGGS